MYNIGEYIVSGNSGVGQIVDIVDSTKIGGTDKKKLYYIVQPLNDGKGLNYVLVNSKRIPVRKVISKDEAETLVKEIPGIEKLALGSQRSNEAKYKEILRSDDFYQWIQLIKGLNLKNEERVSDGKKVGSLDERYMKMAKTKLYSELAVALGIETDEVEDYIRSVNNITD